MRTHVRAFGILVACCLGGVASASKQIQATKLVSSKKSKVSIKSVREKIESIQDREARENFLNGLLFMKENFSPSKDNHVFRQLDQYAQTNLDHEQIPNRKLTKEEARPPIRVKVHKDQHGINISYFDIHTPFHQNSSYKHRKRNKEYNPFD